MPSFNKVILIGNLTRDIETHTTDGGTTIAKLGIATSRKYSTKDGEPREDTTYVDIDAFGRAAEVMAKYLRKGSPVMIEGRLKYDQWETNEGQKRSKLSVVCESFQFLPKGQGSGSTTQEDEPPPV